MKYGFGVDLGGTTVKIAYFDETGNMLDKWEIPTVTAGGGKQILPDIAASVAGYRRDHNIPDEALLGLGIGVPGPVDSSGTVNRCVNLGWGVFNIAKELSDLTGLPVKAGNDANVAALGEYWKGGGQGCENIVFVTASSGTKGSRKQHSSRKLTRASTRPVRVRCFIPLPPLHCGSGWEYTTVFLCGWKSCR